jgi:hypothetical protein
MTKLFSRTVTVMQTAVLGLWTTNIIYLMVNNKDIK